MNGTFYSIGDLRRITRLNAPVPFRLFGFVVAVAVGAILITWINGDLGKQMNHLRREFTAVRTESFHPAAYMRVSVRRLNGTLLAYHLSRSAVDREAFLTQASALKQWLATNESNVGSPAEAKLFKELEANYERYLDTTEKGLVTGDKESPPASFAEVYEGVQGASQDLLRICEELVTVQRLTLDQFLGESEGTMARLQQLHKLSLLLLLTLALSLAALIYRGMIAPLRQKLSESRFVIERQEKLSSLGVLAAGVAHEIRNPLTAIKFRLFSLKKSLPAALADHEDVSIISEEIDRLDRIVKDFLQFARPSDPQLVRVPGGQILREVHALLKSDLERVAIELKLELSETAPVHADAQQIKQVLINLIQNAAESIGRNGTVILRLVRANAQFNGRVGPAAVLQVTDTGKGIPPEIEKRLFDPFFSTKEGGTGLGLAIAARIVEKHGGTLRYQTQLNRGTIFEIVLPRLEDNASQNSAH